MKKLDIDKILLILIAVPIVLALLVGGGTALIKGIIMIAKAVIPNIWTLFAYVYVAIIAYMIGKKSNGSKSGK